MKDSQSNNAIKQNRGRAETERRLIEVALELIQKNGVLAGLNLRQVAEGAGVNRGNIYHYFGSRQDLLRAAINRRFNAFVNAYTKSKAEAGFVARRLRAFASNASNDSNDSMLRALLVLDGDDAVDLRINRVKVTALRCLAHHTPEFARSLERRFAFGADIAFVGPDRSFLAVRKLIPDLAVMNFCHRRIEVVGNRAVHIHANVHFHPEIPVISFLSG